VRTVNVHEAKTQLSALLAEVESGEQVVIARAGVPIAKLVAVSAPKKRKLGMDDGKLRIAADFDHALIPDFEPYS
jgi:prevent-host-death family protein